MRLFFSNYYYLLLLIIIFICINNNVEAQNQDSTGFIQIELPEYYNSKGLIIPAEYMEKLGSKYQKLWFTPTKTEIIEAEKIYYHLVYMILGNFEQGKVSTDLRLKRCYRQYLGVIKDNNEKSIIIIFLDATEPEAAPLLEEWSKYVLSSLQLTQYYRIFQINLDKKELDERSDTLIDEYWFFKAISE